MSGPRPRVAAVVGLGAALLLLGVAVAVGSDWFSGDSGRQVSWTTDKVMLNQSMAALRTLRHQLEAAEPLGRHPDLAEEIGCRPGEGGAGVEQPEGAALQLDGHDSGTAPQRKVVVGGSHEVEARLPGYQVVRRSVTLQPGQSLDIVLDLPPGAPSVRRGSSPGKPLAIVGGLGLGVSGLLLGLGAGLVSIDGSCAPVGTTTCDTVHRSLAAGVTLIVGGVATGIASGVLLYRSR